jgi:Uma2 family endonuclease
MKLTLDPGALMSDDGFYEFCVANPKLRVERTPKGEIIFVPPAGFESDYRNANIVGKLSAWAQSGKRGKAFGPTAEYMLPSGAAYSPDASWVSNERLSGLSKEQKRKFPRLVPEFVIEIMSPSDRLKAAKRKMQDWMADGVKLGWLIDADRQTVYIYRAGHPDPEALSGAASLKGEGPVKGFVLDLAEIWRGL